jgi:hypothetical protein
MEIEYIEEELFFPEVNCQEVGKHIGKAIQSEVDELIQWHAEIQKDVPKPNEEDANRVFMLWDDLSDIYHDLLRGLIMWRRGTSESHAQATWHWRHGYQIHWGEHLFRAMMTVHEARYLLMKN